MKPLLTDRVRILSGEGVHEDLPVVIGRDGIAYSLWSLTLGERLRVLFGSPVAIGVMADRHPPITVGVGLEYVP